MLLLKAFGFIANFPFFQAQLYSMVCVLACNFVNALYAMAADRLSEREGLPFDILRPLIEQTARKAVEADHPREVQTGPAVRGDKVVTDRHCAMLSGDSRQEEIYKLLTEYIWETSKKI